MSRQKVPHRYKAWLIGIGAAALILIGATGGIVVLLSGAYSTAATKQHFGFIYRFLEFGLRFSVEAAARDIQVPDLERVANVTVGHACYREYCAQCHGAPGIAPDEIGLGQLPSPSSLPQSAREWSIEQLFYVTQKGVRMSGMPAWEYRISEAGLWSTVAFLKRMPFLTREQYSQLEPAGAVECPRPTQELPYSVERARTMFAQYACYNCHRIDAVTGPKTDVGPTLEGFHKRKYIAGVLPNTAENLERWIRDPQSISAGSMMPNLSVTEAHARDMARYLLDGQ